MSNKQWEKGFNIDFRSEDCPCKDCKKREMLCHSTCSDYKLYVAKRKANKEEYNNFRTQIFGEWIDDWGKRRKKR